MTVEKAVEDSYHIILSVFDNQLYVISGERLWEAHGLCLPWINLFLSSIFSFQVLSVSTSSLLSTFKYSQISSSLKNNKSSTDAKGKEKEEERKKITSSLV